jgi:hypothetical protein
MFDATAMPKSGSVLSSCLRDRLLKSDGGNPASPFKMRVPA